MEECFATFDKNCDDKLDMQEFYSLVSSIFRNAEKCTFYTFPDDKFKEVFNLFDSDDDGFITKADFLYCWNNWIKTIISPTSALLIVDVQNDFILGTLDIRKQLAKQNAEEIIEPINNLLEDVTFETVVYSFDWHPPDHISFINNAHRYSFHSTCPISRDEVKVYDTVIFKGNPPITQTLWPLHCVQNTWGAQLHRDLVVLDDAIHIYKGTNSTVDSYSAFWDNNKINDTELYNCLKERNITDLFICGVAYDVCVRATALDSMEFGFRTTVIDDCCRGVDVEAIEATKNEIVEKNGVIVNADEVKAMVEGKDRKPELGYQLARLLKPR